MGHQPSLNSPPTTSPKLPTMSNIVNTVKEAVAPADAYPVPSFVISATNPALQAEQEMSNKPGERPGKQDNLQLKAVDDMYANGKPYVGSGKLEGKKALITGGDSGIGRSAAREPRPYHPELQAVGRDLPNQHAPHVLPLQGRRSTHAPRWLYHQHVQYQRLHRPPGPARLHLDQGRYRLLHSWPEQPDHQRQDDPGQLHRPRTGLHPAHHFDLQQVKHRRLLLPDEPPRPASGDCDLLRLPRQRGFFLHLWQHPPP